MNQLHIIFSYIKHQWVAYNRHGIHSPFVYKFLDEVLYSDPKNLDYDQLTKLKQRLLKDSRTISITDLGAGSIINKNPARLVNDIAKNSSKPDKYVRLFYRMVQYFQPKSVIELGTSLGLSTIYFAKAQSKTPIHTLEGCPETLKVAQENFDALQLGNISSHLGDFKSTLPNVLKKTGAADLVFFDGNHRAIPTLNYFEICLKYITDQSIFIFDDIHWSEEMRQTWEKIKGHPKTVVTLDLFFIGIVFFDTRLSRQHFKIRF